MTLNEIMVVGILRLNGNGSDIVHLQDYVYSEEGISATLTARDFKDPRRILIRKGKHDKQ